MIKWKEYKRASTVFQAKCTVGTIGVSVHRRIDHEQDQWLLTSLDFYNYKLRSKELRYAKPQALALVQEKLEDTILEIVEGLWQ